MYSLCFHGNNAKLCVCSTAKKVKKKEYGLHELSESHDKTK